MIPLAVIPALTLGGCQRHDLPSPTEDQPLVVQLSEKETVIGRPVFLRAAILGTNVSWSTPGNLPALVVRSSRSVKSEVGSAYEWEILPLRTGSHVVWTGIVAVTEAGGKRVERPVPFLNLVVRPTLSETQHEPADIEGLERWSDPRWKRLAIGIALVAGIALATALIAIALRRPRKPPPPARRIPPHEIALAAIRSLRAKGIPEGEAVEDFYVDLSAIVRRYVEEAFGLHAPEQTTEEFIRAAADSTALALEHRQLIADFLEQSDLVKFARHRPGAQEIESALLSAERLVTETMPRSDHPQVAPTQP
ncbi:MAG: hypothetical protein NZ740_08535 [Kiritimatiellae bacterium]|nr:hypothetical protein [Kiritimatiellia bacterium]MDW8459140.1 hypothetical protein [Verrucomicrobiota bacterium]